MPPPPGRSPDASSVAAPDLISVVRAEFDALVRRTVTRAPSAVELRDVLDMLAGQQGALYATALSALPVGRCTPDFVQTFLALLGPDSPGTRALLRRPDLPAATVRWLVDDFRTRLRSLGAARTLRDLPEACWPIVEQLQHLGAAGHLHRDHAEWLWADWRHETEAAAQEPQVPDSLAPHVVGAELLTRALLASPLTVPELWALWRHVSGPSGLAAGSPEMEAVVEEALSHASAGPELWDALLEFVSPVRADPWGSGLRARLWRALALHPRLADPAIHAWTCSWLERVLDPDWPSTALGVGYRSADQQLEVLARVLARPDLPWAHASLAPLLPRAIACWLSHAPASGAPPDLSALIPAATLSLVAPSVWARLMATGARPQRLAVVQVLGVLRTRPVAQDPAPAVAPAPTLRAGGDDHDRPAHDPRAPAPPARPGRSGPWDLTYEAYVRATGPLVSGPGEAPRPMPPPYLEWIAAQWALYAQDRRGSTGPSVLGVTTAARGSRPAVATPASHDPAFCAWLQSRMPSLPIDDVPRAPIHAHPAARPAGEEEGGAPS